MEGAETLKERCAATLRRCHRGATVTRTRIEWAEPMSDDKKSTDQTELTIKAGAWIGIAGIALTMILALFGAAGWIVSRIDRVETKIDDLDKRVDALPVDMARMSGQLDLILQQGLSRPEGPAADTASPESGK